MNFQSKSIKIVLIALTIVLLAKICQPAQVDQEVLKSLKVVSCSCERRTILFGRLIALKHPDMAYELFCSSRVRNNSYKILEQVTLNVSLQTSTGYELGEDELHSNPDNYKPGMEIPFKSDSGRAYDSRYNKAICTVKSAKPIKGFK
jgi:hypothetical protein